MDDLQLVPGSKITFKRDYLYNEEHARKRRGGFEICLKRPCRSIAPRLCAPHAARA